MSTELLPYQAAIKGAKERFVGIADPKTYDIESIFAMQALMKTDYSMKIANENPGSVKLAMINVASTGLTLNPAHAYAYLVPRDGAIMLDISYKGLIKIATDTGALLWVRADVVYADDQFTYNGAAAMPMHSANPFKDRGEIIGVYCIAKTKDGDILTEVMDNAELEKIRDKSMAYAKKKAGPWVEWFTQMAKKSVIKRASKTWPYTQANERLMEAIEMANEAEGGYDLKNTITPTSGVWSECSEEEQVFLQGIANHVIELLDTGADLDAQQHIDNQKLNADEQVALWTRFDSKQRSALKKAATKLRQDSTTTEDAA